MLSNYFNKSLFRYKKASLLIAFLMFLYNIQGAKASSSGWQLPNNPGGSLPEDFDDVLVNVINWLLGFVAMVAVLAIVWGGIQYLTSSGSQDQVRSAKDTIKYALRGLFIAGLAYAIVNVVVTTILT